MRISDWSSDVCSSDLADLSVQIEDRQLVIRGKQVDDQSRIYLHRGIAARQFQRSFVLAEGIEITGATLERGSLHVALKRQVVEPEVRTIKSTSAGSSEARRVGNEWVRTCRSRGSQSH